MGLTMGQRKALTREMAARYRGARRPQKKAMLDEFVELHGCTRHHAGWWAGRWGRPPAHRTGPGCAEHGDLAATAAGSGSPQRPGIAVHVDRVRRTVQGGWRATVDRLGGRCVRQRAVRELFFATLECELLDRRSFALTPRRAWRSSSSWKASIIGAAATRHWATSHRLPSRTTRARRQH